MDIKLTMKEQETLNIIMQYKDGAIPGRVAAQRLGLSLRQVQRKKRALLEYGLSSVIHQSKGKPSGRGYLDELKQEILRLYTTEYPNWNFSHFRDTLEDEHGIKVSQTFIYNLLRANGIKSPQKKRAKRKGHPPRPRRENAGELVQVDASKHQWLYGKDEYYYLHGAIDDATGLVTACQLLERETILGYQLLMRDTIKHYGIPECLYTDYRTVFQPNMLRTELLPDDYLYGKKLKDTRFTAMWHRLGSEIISTENPRAKGRIERLWRTFQDRLLKELLKQKIDTITEANRYINKVFLPKYNARFASTIDYNRNHFRPVPKDFDYNRELATCVIRKVLHGSYLALSGHYFVLKDSRGRLAAILSKEPLEVYTNLDGKMWLGYKDEIYHLEPITAEQYRERTERRAKYTQEELCKMRSKFARRNVNSPWRRWNGPPNATLPTGAASNASA